MRMRETTKYKKLRGTELTYSSPCERWKKSPLAETHVIKSRGGGPGTSKPHSCGAVVVHEGAVPTTGWGRGTRSSRAQQQQRALVYCPPPHLGRGGRGGPGWNRCTGKTPCGVKVDRPFPSTQAHLWFQPLLSQLAATPTWAHSWALGL